MRSRESATCVVRSTEVPDGMKISTANWFRSAIGINWNGLETKIQVPAITLTIPNAIVVFGQLKQKAITRSYTFCIDTKKLNFFLPEATASCCSLYIGSFISTYCRYGTRSSATSKDTNRIIVMPQGKSVRKSRNMPVTVSKNGKKVTDIARVAEKMALKNSVPARSVADIRSTPSDISST